MSMVIRDFTDADYESLATVLTVVYGFTMSATQMRFDHGQIDPKCKRRRWVTEVDGKVVGGGEYIQYLGMYHPQKFEVQVAVHPDYRRQGIGAAQYARVMTALKEFDPIALGVEVREDCPDGIRFAESRGWTESMRVWESHLDLTTYDGSAYPGILERMQADGYVVKSYSELADLPDRDRQLFETYSEVRRDIPSTEPITDLSYEQWSKFLDRPNFLGDAYLVAIHGDEWIGLSALWKGEDVGELTTGITAVKRNHRGTGIAKALKMAALERAKQAGYTLVKTWNESNNERMLAINERLGFQRKPAWISYKLKL
jgi:mycothiol synthase